ncbi:uncharacterized protein LOC117586413 [Drosophila guanche]|nr:uncharacterized protein LOC117586413 [Drosophila guanche]
MAANNVPEWINAELFEDVLKSTVPGYTKVKTFKADAGSAAGENYATIMLRVNIEVELEEGKSKDVSYMVKLPHQLELYKEMMKQNNIFDVERLMYCEVVPEMEALYKDVGVDGAYPELLNLGVFKEEGRAMVTEMLNGMMSRFLKVCVTFDGHEEYIEEIKKIIPVAVDEMFKMAKINTQEFNALNHGDFWSNNVMFQYDAFGKVKEVYLVDYQLPKYGTVAQDLLYFLLSSTKLEDKISKFDYYIKFYHDNLIEHLKVLKYTRPLPTLRSIHSSLLKHGIFGFSIVTGVMSAVLLDPSENASFENFVGDSEAGEAFQMQLYTNPRYRKHIQVIMPWLLNRGALETTIL